MLSTDENAPGVGDFRDDGVPRHPMAVAADRTGLSSHVLRAWEKRYAAVDPARTEGGHRMYSDREIHRLRLLRLLTERGRRIGRIAEMETEELESLAAEDRREERRARRLVGLAPDEPSGEEASLEPLREKAMAAVRKMDAGRLADILRRASLDLPVGRMIEGLALPLLHRIGQEWHAGELTVAQEHVASGVIRRSLHWVLQTAGVEDGAPLVVVATLPGERHEGGALAAAAVAHSEGWRVLYLGADIPPEELARACRDAAARAAAVSLVRSPGEDLPATVHSLRDLLPAEVPLLLGGPGGAGLPVSGTEEDGVRWLEDLAGWRAALREQAATGASVP